MYIHPAAEEGAVIKLFAEPVYSDKTEIAIPVIIRQGNAISAQKRSFLPGFTVIILFIFIPCAFFGFYIIIIFMNFENEVNL